MDKQHQRRGSNTGIKNKFTVKRQEDRCESDAIPMYSKKQYQDYELEQLKTIKNVQHLDFGQALQQQETQKNLRMETADLKQVIFSTFDPTVKDSEKQSIFNEPEKQGDALFSHVQGHNPQKIPQISEYVDDQ